MIARITSTTLQIMFVLNTLVTAFQSQEKSKTVRQKFLLLSTFDAFVSRRLNTAKYLYLLARRSVSQICMARQRET